MQTYNLSDVYPAATNVAALIIIAVTTIVASSTYNFFSPFMISLIKIREKHI